MEKWCIKNSKSQIPNSKRISISKSQIPNKRLLFVCNFGHWILWFIWNLMLEIWDFCLYPFSHSIFILVLSLTVCGHFFRSIFLIRRCLFLSFLTSNWNFCMFYKIYDRGIRWSALIIFPLSDKVFHQAFVHSVNSCLFY